MSEAQSRPSCPHCVMPFVRQTRPRVPHEYLGALVQRATFQCQVCGHRFMRRSLEHRVPGAVRDRRHFDRLATQLPAMVAEEHGEVGDGVVTNLSIAGCQLHTRTAAAVGDTLWLALHPTDVYHPIIIEHAVVRSVRTPAVGVHFVQFATAARDHLSQLVRTLLAQQHTASGPTR